MSNSGKFEGSVKSFSIWMPARSLWWRAYWSRHFGRQWKSVVFLLLFSPFGSNCSPADVGRFKRIAHLHDNHTSWYMTTVHKIQHKIKQMSWLKRNGAMAGFLVTCASIFRKCCALWLKTPKPSIFDQFLSVICLDLGGSTIVRNNLYTIETVKYERTAFWQKCRNPAPRWFSSFELFHTHSKRQKKAKRKQTARTLHDEGGERTECVSR